MQFTSTNALDRGDTNNPGLPAVVAATGIAGDGWTTTVAARAELGGVGPLTCSHPAPANP